MEQIAIIFIKNSEDKFFVHKRRDDKKHSPGKYGIGAGGRLDPGEDALTAAKRELYEETGLTNSIEALFDFEFVNAEGQTCHSHFHLTVSDDAIPVHEEEWSSAEWLTADQINKLCEEDKLCIDTAMAWKQFRS